MCTQINRPPRRLALLPLRSRLHVIMQPLLLTLISKIHKTSNLCLLFQIRANQAFAWRNQPYRRAPRPLGRKIQKSSHHLLLYEPPRVDKVPKSFSHMPPRFPHVQLIYWTHTPSYRPCQPSICLWKKFGDHLLKHAPQCTVWFLDSLPHAGGLLMCWRTTVDLAWCHLMTPSSHVNNTQALATSSPRMTSVPLQFDSWPDLKT